MDKGVYLKKRDFTIFGTVGVCAMTKEKFLKEIFSMVPDKISSTVMLIGVPAVVAAKEDPKLAEMYNNATIATIDGMPIVKLALKKNIECERCAAPDFMGMVFKEGVKQGKTHYFYGGKNEKVLEKLKENLERTYPGIKIVGMYSPPFRPLTEEEDLMVCNEINELKPDFLWVGIGAPKQEMWMWQHQEKINNTIMFGVGAGFDFLAGTLDKAPVWIEKLGLEWLFRLVKEPKRLWRRYVIGGFKYIYYTIKDKKEWIKW